LIARDLIQDCSVRERVEAGRSFAEASQAFPHSGGRESEVDRDVSGMFAGSLT
jgi:hypothetical protein